MRRWQTKEALKELLVSMVEYPSITGTAEEKHMGKEIYRILGNFPYFKEHSDFLRLHETFDGNNFVTAFSKSNSNSKKTVVLMSHFDVVDIEDYGELQNLAFKPLELTKYFYDNPPEELREGLNKGDWLFGRGTLDMKSGLALHISLLEQACEGRFDGNILLLTVPDEECNSTGMRSAVPILQQLKKEYGLEYQACITSEPMFSKGKVEDEYFIYSGSIGKVLPGYFCYGKETHVGEPFNGLNANLMVSELLCEIELNPELTESVTRDEHTPPPTTLLQRDLKKEYSTQVPHKSLFLFNLFMMEKPLDEMVNQLLEIARTTSLKIQDKYANRLSRYGTNNLKINVLTFEQLLKYALNTFGEKKLAEIEKRILTLYAGEDDRNLTIRLVDAIATLCKECAPMIVLFFSPPYYFPIDSSGDANLSKIIKEIQEFAQQKFDIDYKHQFYFPGVSDLSYASFTKEISELNSLVNNMPVWEKTYSLPIEELSELDMPVLNLGVLGKDAHKWSERLELNFSFVELKDLLEFTLDKFFRQSPQNK